MLDSSDVESRHGRLACSPFAFTLEAAALGLPANTTDLGDRPLHHGRSVARLPRNQQNLSLEIERICNVEPRFPRDNIVGNHLCDV